MLLQVYGNVSAHAEVRRRRLDYMEAEAKHYRDFVAGSAPITEPEKVGIKLN